ncbi:TetR/AcrR family transcriptional regulator [Dactylosporangium sp. CA-233914]|uniref:TetR/AcrR family transcriptional regulator n=1 Tax=Dactylosporangium sp. CA-233914 TaxID=3239934 RepID=UPI003D8AB1CD
MGLRERKKEATRTALREAALRLALEHGPDNVRVDDIAEAAGVSPRTYNNYFASREHAIVAAVTAERQSRVAAAVMARPPEVPLSAAVTDAVVGQHLDPAPESARALLMITASPALRATYVQIVSAIEEPLAAAIAERSGVDPATAEVLAASVGAAARLALSRWLQQTTTSPSATGLVVPTGSLPDLMRAALAPLGPALDAAAE